MAAKALGVLIGVISMVVVLSTADAAMQRGQGGGRGPAHYNLAAEVRVSGTVEALQAGPSQGMHVTIKASDQTLELVLGPSWYQTEKNYVLANGDRIDVIGAKGKVDGRDVLFVREIRKGTQTMTFRDANGFPMWAGRGPK